MPRNSTALPEPPTTTALAPAEDRFAILSLDSDTFREVIAENLGPAGGSPTDLDRVRVPGAGGTSWLVPTLKGEVEEKELVGIITAWRDVKVFWVQSMDESGGGTPPDCHSDDCITGHGNPGGACADCPNNVFGSASKGGGKACKDLRLLFFVRSGDRLPLIVTVPPSSLQNIRRYFTRLTAQGIPYYGAVTSLSLERTKNGGGIQYSEITASLVDSLSADELARSREYSGQIRTAFQTIRIDNTDMAAEPDDAEARARAGRRLMAVLKEIGVDIEDADWKRRIASAALGTEVPFIRELTAAQRRCVADWADENPAACMSRGEAGSPAARAFWAAEGPAEGAPEPDAPEQAPAAAGPALHYCMLHGCRSRALDGEEWCREHMPESRQQAAPATEEPPQAADVTVEVGSDPFEDVPNPALPHVKGGEQAAFAQMSGL